jgi:RNA polymerase sigma factor (sigma-70 family)
MAVDVEAQPRKRCSSVIQSAGESPAAIQVRPSNDIDAKVWDLWMHPDRAAVTPELVEYYSDWLYGLARSVTKRRRSRLDVAEVAHSAYEILVKKVASFNVAHGSSFAAHSAKPLAGAMMSYLRSNAPQARMRYERKLLVEELSNRYRAEYGRLPSHSQLLQMLMDQGLSAQQADNAMVHAQFRPPVSLDRIVLPDSRGGDGLRNFLSLAQIEDLIRHLPVQDREAFGLLYVNELSQQEVARRLQKSESWVSYLNKRSLLILRSYLSRSSYEPARTP